MKAIRLAALHSTAVCALGACASLSRAFQSNGVTTLLSTLIILPTLTTSVSAQEVGEDAVAECDQWASQGECTLNPRYMEEHCPNACKRQAAVDREMAAKIGELILWAV